MNGTLTRSNRCALFFALSFLSTVAGAQTVQISKVSANPAVVRTGGPRCSTITVQIAVNRGTADRAPVLALSLVKGRSYPVNMEFIFPEVATIQVPQSGAFDFTVCVRGESPPGKFTVAAGILGVAPEDKYKALLPEDGADQVEITVNP